MRQIHIEEQKKILLEILKYIDGVCRKNNINYSLIGGSLIGAVRHKGIIPWDDDIDIILSSYNYNKLIEYIKNNPDERYKLFDITTSEDYYYPFAKIVDTKTIIEENNLKPINNLGIYVDIFKYNKVPENPKTIRRYYKKLMNIKKEYGKSVTIKLSEHKLLNYIYKLFAIKDSRKITKKFIKYSEKYNNIDTNNIISNWPTYGVKNETQILEDFKKYIDIDFENMKAMVMNGYDNVLTKTFGDYMTPPPKKAQISNHSMKAFWKDESK